MSQKTAPVTVRILDKEYRVGCTDNEKNDLMASAEFLDAKMKEVRDGGGVVGLDRIAVMTALNIAHELLKLQSLNDSLNHSVSHRIKALEAKISGSLIKENQLEL